LAESRQARKSCREAEDYLEEVLATC